MGSGKIFKDVNVAMTRPEKIPKIARLPRLRMTSSDPSKPVSGLLKGLARGSGVDRKEGFALVYDGYSLLSNPAVMFKGCKTSTGRAPSPASRQGLARRHKGSSVDP
jgi:hypothetical protein